VSPYFDYGPYILMFLAIITFFLGTFLIWRGRSEIGEKHINSVETGLWLIIILLATTSIFGIFLDITINNSLSFFILNLMIMLASFYFLKNIVKKQIKNIIWIAIFMFVILNPLIPLITHVIPNDYYINLYRLILQILSLVIPYMLLAICYYTTYKDIKNKVHPNKKTS
jgi:hypothetical protein